MSRSYRKLVAQYHRDYPHTVTGTAATGVTNTSAGRTTPARAHSSSGSKTAVSSSASRPPTRPPPSRHGSTPAASTGRRDHEPERPVLIEPTPQAGRRRADRRQFSRHVNFCVYA
jgi:hypothetical protein